MTYEEEKARDLLAMIEVKEPNELLVNSWWGSFAKDYKEALQMAIEALEQQPCEDCVSRQEAINCVTLNEFRYKIVEDMKTLPSVTPKEKTGYCKDCKWWKDNDGVYRRGIGAESKCPINSKKVYEGNGYCYLFEPQESEDKE